jgi:predicted Zn-dependent protease with MMP-like domain
LGHQIDPVIADWNQLCRLASSEVDAILAALPEPLRAQAEKLPVMFESRPGGDMQAEGIEADTLGLFTGADFVEEGHVLLPAQIFLYLKNIWNFAEDDEKTFRREIRTTFLHELGHYFGLDEGELTDRRLD